MGPSPPSISPARSVVSQPVLNALSRAVMARTVTAQTGNGAG